MVQVKTVVGATTTELDKNINEWIGRNRQYTILNVNPFYREDKAFNHGAMIVYEVKIPDAKKY